MRNLLLLFIVSLFSLGLISGCSNDNPAAVVPAGTIEGTAATGAGIDGTVTVIDANGVEVTVSTSPDGSYSVLVPDLTPPFMIRVIPNGVGETLYSFAAKAGQIVNITPLTNQAMSLASGNGDLATIYMSWDGTGITETQVDGAGAILRANLSAQITAAGLDPTTFDLFNDAFNADGTGFDGVLDLLTFTTDTGGAITFVDSSDSTFSFNPGIDVSDFIGGGAGSGGGTLGENETAATIPASIAGTYNLTFSETAAGSGIADGAMTEFVVGTDGTLTIDGNLTLSNPVFYRGNGEEAIWFDTVNGVQYALSALTFGFNEINVANDTHFDQTGFTFYGQYRDAAAAAAPFVCAGPAGMVAVGGSIPTDAITGDVHCPGSLAMLDPVLGKQVGFVDPGGPDFIAHPSSSLNVFADNGLETGGSTLFFVEYSVGASVWRLEVANGVLSNSGVIVDSVAKTVTFSGTSQTVLPARVLLPGNATAQIVLTGTLTYQ